MKPIEEGCLAIIINSKAGNNGIAVTVGKYIGLVSTLTLEKQWKINKSVRTLIIGYMVNYADESQLMRIDGKEFESEQETEKVFVDGGFVNETV